MTFDSLWQQLVNKTPRLTDDNAVVEIKAIQLKRLLRQAYDAGAKHDPPANTSTPDFLSQLFKGR